MSWVRYRVSSGSWHIVRRMAGTEPGGSGWVLNFKALCGKVAQIPEGSWTLPKPPEKERTCERCFQLREAAL